MTPELYEQTCKNLTDCAIALRELYARHLEKLRVKLDARCLFDRSLSNEIWAQCTDEIDNGILKWWEELEEPT